MSHDWELLRAIFHAARHFEGDVRKAYLDDACEGQPGLRAKVEAMLQEESSDFLAAPLLGAAIDLAAFTPASDEAESPQGNRRTLPDIPGYRILSLIGSGGMGTVYEAQQETPRRTVAIKVLRDDMRDQADELSRFRREADLLARLDHPNIVGVLEAGRAGDGRPFFAMEHVRGEPLDEWASRIRSSTERCVRLFITLSRAVHAAHVRGVIHRDLKPSNVLVDTEDRPHVLDFGLAADRGPHEVRTQLTQTGQIMGTLHWMSPEQISGRTRDVETRSDVHALGLMLMEALTGRTAYDLSQRSVPEAARIICESAPIRPGSVRPELRGDLETIILKAIEKEPERRYASAAAFGDDLERFLEGRPILARPSSTIYHVRRFVARHRTATVITTTLLIGVLALTIVSSLLALRFSAERDAAVEARTQAERLAYRSALSLADRLIAAHEPGEARRALEGTPQSLRGWEWRWQMARTRPTSLPVGDAHALRLIPSDGEAPTLLLARPDARTLVLQTLDEAEPIATFKTETTISAIAVSRAGTHVAAGETSGALSVWCTRTGERLHHRPPLPPAERGMHVTVSALVLSPNGERMLVNHGLTTLGGYGMIIDFRTQAVRRIAPFDAAHIGDDGKITLTRHDRISVLDASAESLRFERRSLRPVERVHDSNSVPREMIAALDVRAQDHAILTGHAWGAVQLWRPSESSEEAQVLAQRDHAILHVAFDNQGDRAFCVDAEGGALMIDLVTGEVQSLSLPESHAFGLAPCGTWLWCAGREAGCVSIVPVPESDDLSPSSSHVTGTAFASKAPLMVHGRTDGNVEIRLLNIDSAPMLMQPHDAAVIAVASCPQGRFILSVCPGGSVHIGRTDDSADLRRSGAHPLGVRDAWIAPDGHRYALLDTSGSVILRDDRTPDVERILSTSPGAIGLIDWTTNLVMLSGGASDPSRLDLFDLRSGQRLRTFSVLAAPIAALACHPDEELIAIGDESGNITVIELKRPDHVHHRSFGRLAMTALAFTPEGHRIAAGTMGRIGIWAIDDAEPLLELPWPTALPRRLHFDESSDRLLAVDGPSNRVRQWRTVVPPLPTESLR